MLTLEYRIVAGRRAAEEPCCDGAEGAATGGAGAGVGCAGAATARIQRRVCSAAPMSRSSADTTKASRRMCACTRSLQRTPTTPAASATRSRRQQSAQLCRKRAEGSARSVAAPASTCRGRHGPSPAHFAAVPRHCRHWFAAANQCGCHRPRLLVRCLSPSPSPSPSSSPSPSPSRGPGPDPNSDSNLRRQRLQSHGRHAHIPWHTHGGRAHARVALAAVPRRTVDEADARAH